MDRSIMDAIRQQSEDLREELKDLEQWEVEMERAADARQRRMQNSDANATLEPPVRGTVPSIKQALADMAKKEGRQLPPQQDPIKLAKDRGNEYFRIGKIDEAIHAYTTGIDLDPGSSTSHILYANRSMCYLKQSAWEKAEKDASICIQMNHGYAKAYFRRALARKNLHKLKDARSDLESVLALAPSDTSASTELEVVTKMLQAERANAASGGASLKKKKIVIEEVEDEDEEDGEEPTTTTAAPSAEEEEARQKRLAAQMKEYEERRVQEELKSVAAAKKEEAAKDAKRRRNNRVEIIEEVEEEVVPTPAPTTKAAPPPSAQASSTTKTATATATTAAAAAAAPATAAPRETSAPRPAAPLPTLDSLRCPSSFTEFERVFAQIEAHDALRNHYISLMNPFGLGELFGSNLTPEILSGFLASIRTFSGSVALQFMKGLTKVKRMEEIALFFDDGDKALVTEVLGLIKTSGASAAELKLLQSRFQPF